MERTKQEKSKPVRYVSISSIELDHEAEDQLRPEKPNPRDTIWVTLVVRSKCSDQQRSTAVKELSFKPPHERRTLSWKQYEQRFGSSKSDFRKLLAFAKKFGLRVVKAIPASCAIRLTGALAKFSKAFAVEFVMYETAQHEVYRSHSGPVQVPADLAPMIEGVFGFDTRPLNASPFASAAAPQPLHLTPPAEAAKAYQFPKNSLGKGQAIAIIELGGGFHQADLVAFFANQELKKPRINVVSINGKKNNPASAEAIQKAWNDSGLQPVQYTLAHGPDGTPGAYEDNTKKGADSPKNIAWTIESTVDIEVSGALANEAQFRVYFAHNTMQGKFDAYLAALFDEKVRPGAISCSWGAPEDAVSPQYAKLMDRIFQCAALLGVTIVYSAGDTGDGSQRGSRPCVHFPASSPHVLAVGGTQLLFSGGTSQESYWDEWVGKTHCLGGHGISKKFAQPVWQAHSGMKGKSDGTGRAVPDVSGKADLHTGYACVIGDIKFPGGGTSAAAPMWAALIARLNSQLRTPVGLLAPLLYTKEFSDATHPVGEYPTQKSQIANGWSPLTGRGSPLGEALLAALTNHKR
jgi:kumamolisin